MEFFAKIVNGFEPLTIFAKCSVLDGCEVLNPHLHCTLLHVFARNTFLFFSGLILGTHIISYLDFFKIGHTPLICFTNLFFYFYHIKVHFLSYKRLLNLSYIELQSVLLTINKTVNSNIILEIK